jgi:hypothetical protein
VSFTPGGDSSPYKHARQSPSPLPIARPVHRRPRRAFCHTPKYTPYLVPRKTAPLQGGAQPLIYRAMDTPTQPNAQAHPGEGAGLDAGAESSLRAAEPSDCGASPEAPSRPDVPVPDWDEIDGMSLEELETRLPQLQASLNAIESKLEELMGLRDATLISAAAMSGRLAALKQSVEPERDKGS